MCHNGNHEKKQGQFIITVTMKKNTRTICHNCNHEKNTRTIWHNGNHEKKQGQFVINVTMK